MIRSFLFLCGVLILGNAAAALAAELKSGIQVGESVKSFSPLHVTGPDAGKTSCLV
jgi:hypothetical protein